MLFEFDASLQMRQNRSYGIAPCSRFPSRVCHAHVEIKVAVINVC